MTSETKFSSAFPVDVGALWDMNGRSLDYAERAYRAWLDAAGEMQNETIDFLNSRLAKDSALIARLGQCKTPVEAFSVQADYAGHAFADIVNEGQKIAVCFGNAAREGMFSGPAEEPGSKAMEAGSRKRSAHRATGH
jgi:hypothetical protein